jgi:hypothetical protein
MRIRINTAGSHQSVVRRKLYIPAKGMHNAHSARDKSFSLIPVSKRLVDCFVEHVVIGFFPQAKVWPEFRRRVENDVAIGSIREEGGILLDPFFGLADAAGRAEAGFTGMGHPSFFFAFRTPVSISSVPHLSILSTFCG